MPTADDFQALARSSPWLWRSAHLRYRGGLGEAEAWIERPGRTRVRPATGEEQVLEEDRPSVAYLSFGGTTSELTVKRPHEVEPVRRTDGLVSARPQDLSIVYGDPVWRNYSWVALLDPVELSSGVAVDRVGTEVRSGRETWTARLVPLADYQATCGCCALLWSRVAADEAGFHEPGATYPSSYDVALDRATGIVVSARPSTPGFEDRSSLAFEVDVVSHDAWPSVG